MKYAKKIIILNEITSGFSRGTARGVGNIEKTPSRIEASVNIFGLEPLKYGSFIVGVGSQNMKVQKYDAGRGGRINIKYQLDYNTDTESPVFMTVVFKDGDTVVPVLFGSNNNRKTVYSNLLDGFIDRTDDKELKGHIGDFRREDGKDKERERYREDSFIREERAAYRNYEETGYESGRKYAEEVAYNQRDMTEHGSEPSRRAQFSEGDSPAYNQRDMTEHSSEPSRRTQFSEGDSPAYNRDIQDDRDIRPSYNKGPGGEPEPYFRMPFDKKDGAVNNYAAGEKITDGQENIRTGNYGSSVGKTPSADPANTAQKTFYTNSKIDKNKINNGEGVFAPSNPSAARDNVFDGEYSDTQVAAENYYPKGYGMSEAGFTLDGGAETNRIDPAKIMIKKPVLTFYQNVKPQIDELFKKYPAEEILNKKLPGTAWVKVDYSKNGKYYIVGLIGEEPKYICYGVPATYTSEVPEELSNCQWLPVNDNKPDGEGFWVMYQSAETGETVELQIM